MRKESYSRPNGHPENSISQFSLVCFLDRSSIEGQLSDFLVLERDQPAEGEQEIKSQAKEAAELQTVLPGAIHGALPGWIRNTKPVHLSTRGVQVRIHQIPHDRCLRLWKAYLEELDRDAMPKLLGQLVFNDLSVGHRKRPVQLQHLTSISRLLDLYTALLLFAGLRIY